MLRFALPLFLVLAAAFVTWQNLDGDGEFFLLPLVEVLPGVGEDLAARGRATSAILFGFAGLSFVLQGLAFRRSQRRKREIDQAMESVDAVRDWQDEAAWDDRLTEREGPEGEQEAGEMPAHDG